MGREGGEWGVREEGGCKDEGCYWLPTKHWHGSARIHT